MRLNITSSSKAASLQALRDAGYPISGLLGSEEVNPKVAKNGKVGALTWQLHLTPFNYSGRQVCAKATDGCSQACLHFAGNPVYMNQKERSRQYKTDAYFDHRGLFVAHLINELKSLVAKAKRKGMIPGCRLNATSDIKWERVSFTLDGVFYANVMELFPQITFYDYTKHTNRVNLPDNYNLTFSLAEDNDADALQALENGINVAAVFDTKRGRNLPSEYMGFPVHDGDEHDFRPLDPAGHIIGLRAKGPAIGDTSGFVRMAA